MLGVLHRGMGTAVILHGPPQQSVGDWVHSCQFPKCKWNMQVSVVNLCTVMQCTHHSQILNRNFGELGVGFIFHALLPMATENKLRRVISALILQSAWARLTCLIVAIRAYHVHLQRECEELLSVAHYHWHIHSFPRRTALFRSSINYYRSKKNEAVSVIFI